jgi:hypothetical protein
MERLLDQLCSLSSYVNYVFLDIANQTLDIQQRLGQARATLDAFAQRIPTQMNPPESKPTSLLFNQEQDGMAMMELSAICSTRHRSLLRSGCCMTSVDRRRVSSCSTGSGRTEYHACSSTRILNSL